ncbi:bud site selection protein [Kickxella alabastrina]|uniref:Bud site selection protein n=1 Tax=Kickxella alabastrina TaxID=61397 RepID=A0ACC1INF3_9FUNG|nr:bud site selection protein [Kickxella alabastrina]
MIRELGPPDLCHIVKTHSSNKNEPEIGSYHHVLGADTSSSASLAAYINSLQYSLSDTPGWFGTSNSWKISSGTYCSYNAFSNVDLRVQIKIPGGVDAYIVTVQGERKEVSEDFWRECHISSFLRAILHSDPQAYSATGLRRVTPVRSPDEEARLADTLLRQFSAGWALGSNAETQAISTACNHLTDGLRRYFGGAGRFADYAADLLAPLTYASDKGVDPEIAALLADAYIHCDEEVQAVRVMHQALKAKPSCAPLLLVQAEFLRRKHQPVQALALARMAVKYAPSEFHAWAKLAHIYTDAGDFHRALLTLNACPMYTYVGRDLPRVPAPRRINYPLKSDILADYNLGEPYGAAGGNNAMRASVDSDAPGRVEEMAQNETSDILRLSAPTLNGTFAAAYRLLADIFGEVGWDELLMLRSQVFVMEEEYRNSAMPGAAVDDEEEGEDVDEDQDQDRGRGRDEDEVPLATLHQRAEIEGRTETSAKASAEQTPATTPDAEPEPGPEPEAPAAAEHEIPAAAAAASDAATEPEAPAAAEHGISAVAEPESAAAAAAVSAEQTQQAVQSKGKRKNKKNKGKKAQNPVEEEKGQQQPEDETKQPEEPAVRAADSAIATLGDKMDDVSLSDNEAPADSEAAASIGPKAEAQPDAQPVVAATPEPDTTAQVAAPRIAVLEPTDAPAAASSSTSNAQALTTDAPHPGIPQVRKRLCERWLDNLIMMLFEDLRAYTSWRSRLHNLRTTGQQVTYIFTQAEWESLGELSLRLHRPSDAKEAFEYALAIRFSAKAWMRLLELYTGKFAEMQKKEVARYGVPVPMSVNSSEALLLALDAVVWLSVYNDRWYNNMVYPNPVCEHVVSLVRIHGLSKVRNSLVSMNLKPAVYNLVKGYFEFAEKFNVTGAQW